MKNLYDKISFNESWNVVEGFFAALDAMYNIYKKNNETKLIYPIIDLTFHTMEKIACSLLIINKSNYIGNHSKIRGDFIKEFEGQSTFIKILDVYGEIYDTKDKLLYKFEQTITKDKLISYIETVKQFKERAEFYIANKSGKK